MNPNLEATLKWLEQVGVKVSGMGAVPDILAPEGAIIVRIIRHAQ